MGDQFVISLGAVARRGNTRRRLRALLECTDAYRARRLVTAGSPVTHAQLDQVLGALRFGIGPSDLHGSLTGYLCGGGAADSRGWLAALELDVDHASALLPHELLTRLYEQCSAWFGDPELAFEPLLPPAEVALDQRTEALVEWCRGFLGGLGLAGVSRQHGLSSEGAEILKDLATIAGTRFEFAGGEEDERALEEVIEFIRAGVLLLHAEIAAAPPAHVTLH